MLTKLKAPPSLALKRARLPTQPRPRIRLSTCRQEVRMIQTDKMKATAWRRRQILHGGTGDQVLKTKHSNSNTQNNRKRNVQNISKEQGHKQTLFKLITRRKKGTTLSQKNNKRTGFAASLPSHKINNGRVCGPKYRAQQQYSKNTHTSGELRNKAELFPELKEKSRR